MNGRRIIREIRILALAMICYLSGCAHFRQQIFTEPEIYTALQENLTPEELNILEIPFHATPEMHTFARKTVGTEKSSYRRALLLVEAMVSNWKLDVTYDQKADHTAQEVFSKRRGNCLAFTNLFISLSRSIGMQTTYVDVTQAEEIYFEDNLIVNSGHICAGLHDGAQFYLIDFNRNPEKNYRIYREIDDFEALANHYNNLAYRQSGTAPEALTRTLHYYDLAIRIKPSFTRARNNKGVTLSLLGDHPGAEKAYLETLTFDPDMPEANCNLGSIFFSRGQYEQSVIHFRKAVQQKPRNLQYRYRLAMAYYYSSQTDFAIQEFKNSIKVDRLFAKGYLGLAMAYHRKGDIPKAMENYKRAFELDASLQEASVHYQYLNHQ